MVAQVSQRSFAALVAVVLLSVAAVAQAANLMPPSFDAPAAVDPSQHSSAAAAAQDGTFNVKSYGAMGNGIADDTAAIQAAMSACRNATYGGQVLFPAGLFRVTAPIHIEAGSGTPMTIAGLGWSSNVLWESNTNVFVWATAQPVTHLTVQNLAITSTKVAKSAASTAFSFSAGVVKSLFSNLLFYGAGGVPGTGLTAQALGSCINTGTVADTVSIVNTVMWFLQGTGVTVGRGSEVRITGGRIIGLAKRNDGSVGVDVTGNNGGVHLVDTDIIALQYGVILQDSTGAGSNREIFINQATMDSNWRGLSIHDDSYVTITGCWAASSDQENIWVSPQSTNALLMITGGTIFNAGALGGDPAAGQANGITVNAGVFHITGVAVRNNKGNALWVPNPSAVHYSIVGCHFFGNGVAFNITGAADLGFLISSNVVSGNAAAGNANQPQGSLIVDNVGLSS